MYNFSIKCSLALRECVQPRNKLSAINTLEWIKFKLFNLNLNMRKIKRIVKYTYLKPKRLKHKTFQIIKKKLEEFYFVAYLFV